MIDVQKYNPAKFFQP